MEYKVTIGIPVYNVEKHIRLTMDSALAQTFESIEFLVLDDCGTDGSMDIVREYQQTHARGKDIRIVRQPKNMGIGAGRNRIVEEAQGRYLYFMDADDSILPHTIDLLYENAQKYHAQLVYGSYERIEEFGVEKRREAKRYPAMQFLDDDTFATYAYQRYDRIEAMIWNILIDIDVYRKNGLRHKLLNYWEDFMLTMDLPTYVSRVVLLPDITYSYYCREGSLSNFQKRKSISKQEFLSTVEALEEIKDSSGRLRGKSYFPLRMQKVMMTDFYIVCTILRSKAIISPSFTKREIRDVMKSPLSLTEILKFTQARWINLMLYAFWKLPPSLSVALMRLVAKMRKLRYKKN